MRMQRDQGVGNVISRDVVCIQQPDKLRVRQRLQVGRKHLLQMRIAPSTGCRIATSAWVALAPSAGSARAPRSTHSTAAVLTISTAR